MWDLTGKDVEPSWQWNKWVLSLPSMKRQDFYMLKQWGKIGDCQSYLCGLGTVWSGVPLFVNVPGFPCSFWERLRHCRKKVDVKLLFRASWGHCAASVCTGKNRKCAGEHKGCVQEELCMKTEWWNWAMLENWELVSHRRKWTKRSCCSGRGRGKGKVKLHFPFCERTCIQIWKCSEVK